jgi:hypothetical protein
MEQMNKPEELDLRTVLTRPEPVRCSVSAEEVYEVRFEVLACRDRLGHTNRMHVLRSIDAGKTWQPVRIKRNWRKQWRAILVKGLGGLDWPPSREDFIAAYVKDGAFTVSYHGAYSEGGPNGQAYVWEMQYAPNIDRWNLAMLQEIWPDKDGGALVPGPTNEH